MKLRAWSLCVVLFAVACGPKNLHARMAESEEHAGEADAALTRAEQAMRNLEVESAEKSLKEANEILTKPNASLYPEYEMLTARLAQRQGQIPAVRAALEKRRLDERVAKQRGEVESLVEKAKKPLEAMKGTAFEKGDIKDAESALDGLREALLAGAELETKDAGYKEKAKQTGAWLEAQWPTLQLAKGRLEFAETASEKSVAGKADLAAAKKEKVVDARRERYEKAIESFEACVSLGQALLKKYPKLESASVAVGKGSSSPDKVLAECRSAMQATKISLSALPKKKAPKKPAPARASSKKPAKK